MVDLLLRERDQASIRAVIATEPVPAVPLSDERVLRDVARLIPCDAIGLAVLQVNVPAATGPGPPAGRAGEAVPADGGTPGIRVRRRARAARDGAATGVATLSLGVRHGPDHVVRLWLVRHTSDFSERDRALLRLIAPALERLLRERRTSSLPPSLTVQERRVLHHVAAGLTNAEIAERLVVAPSTVRKHLENAYRKLGVRTRLAAVVALEGSHRADGATPAPADVLG